MIEILLQVLTFIFFGYSAFLDLFTRQVRNLVWITYFLACTPLILLHQIPYPFCITFISVVFAYLLWRFRIVGGADSKALIVLSLVVPSGFSGTLAFFPFIAFALGCVFANIHIVHALIKKQEIKKLQIPLLFYMFFGILLAVAVTPFFT